MKEIKISENDIGKRIDNFISKYYPNLLRVLIFKYIRTKKIKVNNKKIYIDYRLKEGDLVQIYINENSLSDKNILQKYEDNLSFMSSNDDLDIIYENNDLLILNKPAGLLVHSSKKNDDNLIDKVKKYLFKNNEYNPENENTFTPALSNRLDRNTSGLVIVSKNYRTLRKINENIESKEIQKFYYTYVYGKFDEKEGILKHFLKKDEKNNVALVSDKKNSLYKSAILKYRVIKYYPENNISMLDIQLFTGRFHQIRAQLSHINHPLIGDGKYFDPNKHNFSKINYKYQILVAYKLVFDKELSSLLFHINSPMAFQIPDIYKYLKEKYKFK